PEKRYYIDNGFFRHGSAFSLYAMLRQFQPKRVIEIGSGFTSALMLDTNDRFLDGKIEFVFIEPNPARLTSLLREDDWKRCRIIEDIVQNVPVSTFDTLGPGDMLFVDSSHVSKVGSDVNHIFFEILPTLRSGVIIHIHDIYWPFEYPEQWIAEGISWNEAYLLRAFLQYNNKFEILQFNDYLVHRFREYYQKSLSQVLEDSGSSIWLRKV
ncbi:MAG: class I SAM-dependent methyltransferase, partial [Gammaproteobacteria bacterium]|nr:class I SAM-dependent methyltransferase [Gammaproteobacteria bacterium]NIX02650.1 class I SAM-dependent methyltransferase [Phycisphaerae bacterium]